jgi:BirA family transcriptional regulator, biotin operon repressor / biotin---[acetyl-CoA-carboxylase] ligase
VPSSWSDLDRPPLSAARLATVTGAGSVWTRIDVVERTASTNADVAAAAESGEPAGYVLVAEQQDAGRGRLDRAWESPPRAGLLLSGLLRPAVPPAALPLLPLLAGLAVAEAVRAVADVPAVLKWPNDVLAGGRKLAGILVERTAGGAVVIGLGLNVTTRPDELPVDTATSLAIEGGRTDREPLAKEILRALARRYTMYVETDGSPGSVLPAYREVCETIGRQVVVQVPGGGSVTGTAVAVDDGGMLLVRGPDGADRAWSAGDVIHVRTEC